MTREIGGIILCEMLESNNTLLESVGWLVGWLFGWLVGWMVGWLDGWMDG